MTLRRRRLIAGVAAWVFGLASTVLLIGMWGRAVVTDTERLAESLDPMAGSSLVADRFAAWLEEELVEAGVDPVQAGDAGAGVVGHPEVTAVLEDLVAATVAAAATDDPDGSVVDVAELLRPRVEAITAGLNSAGLPVTTAQVVSAIDGLEPLVIRAPGQAALIGASSPLAANLGTAVLGALALMVGSGWVYVRASPDRIRAMRSLLQRFGLGAFSFAVLLRLGSWVTDPEGGRAPVGETLSRLADSKTMLPLLLGLGALAGAGALWLGRRRVRSRGGTPSRDEPATAPAPVPR